MQLVKTEETDPELVYVDGATKKWKSPGKGWLGPQAGIWTQFPDGFRLMDPAGKEELAYCKALDLGTCTVLQQGASNYAFSGGKGKWEILGIF
jgi:hypothetical protein